MVRVIIEFRAKAGKGDELYETVLRLKATAMEQPGYISEEILRGYDDISLVLVIGTWVSAEDWRHWQRAIEHSELIAPIDTLLEEEPRTRIWALSGKRE